MRSRTRAIGQVLRARDGGLRAQASIVRQAVERQLERRIPAQAVGLVGVLLARRDHEQAETDDLRQSMNDSPRRSRIFLARRKPVSDPEQLLDLPQAEHAGIRGQPSAIEAGDHGFAGNR
jgi:hypothetical protein